MCKSSVLGGIVKGCLRKINDTVELRPHYKHEISTLRPMTLTSLIFVNKRGSSVTEYKFTCSLIIMVNKLRGWSIFFISKILRQGEKCIACKTRI